MMTDRELAEALRDADRRGDDYMIPILENEVVIRLGLDPNQTEQGLTFVAAKAVDTFIRQHATPEPERINGLS